MNAVEIEEAISLLADQPFDPENFPYAFLEAFGNKVTTIKRLRSGTSNKSDVGGVLQTSNIHIKVADEGAVAETLAALKASPATVRARAKFVLATDGKEFQAEDLNTGEVIVCDYPDFPDHFGFFLPLAGISTVKQIRESAFDIKATGRLNRLYVELLKDNPEWGTAERRHDMNHFMARLIFCFFAEDTDIFREADQFTATIDRMSEKDSSNTHEIISELFRSMNTKIADREKEGIARWANNFPYVNGGLFSERVDVPRFSRIARSYLLHIGNLDWTKINPDIFGSMIQAVADDEERGALGMHYTSVPNILKVLNPLFLDDLREKLEEAGDNARKLLNLRNRMAKIRVFDPACGSGNFLVIAYKQMRAIEAEINKRRSEADRRSEIPLTNFRGIELRDFPAEVARLALIIAEYQCDVLYRGQREALRDFLPLDAMNWITCGNALKLDWLDLWGSTGAPVKVRSDDLFGSPLDQAEIDFENEGGETYICGNPPYKGTKNQTKKEKEELKQIFGSYTNRSGTLDYVSGWFLKAAQFMQHSRSEAAFVSTNSICQGGQVPVLWPLLYELGVEINFAYHSFKWNNLASNNAGVTVVIVGFSTINRTKKLLFQISSEGEHYSTFSTEIGPYLIPGNKVIVVGSTNPLSKISPMSLGNAPYEGGYLIFESSDVENLPLDKGRWLRPLLGSTEVISGTKRYCIWIDDIDLEAANKNEFLRERIEAVRSWRLSSKDAGTRSMSDRPHQFREMKRGNRSSLIVPIRSSENREYLPVDLFDSRCVATNLAYVIYDGPIMNLALIASRIHLVWVSAVCGKLETRFSYSNKMGWHTFPLPLLTEKNVADLTKCAEDILLAREAHFPATIADLYEVKDGVSKMPDDLRAAHDRNDEVLERIYVGRRFKNDTERLEKLFELYTKMTGANSTAKKAAGAS
ncbi:lactate dehydrogenase [Thalassospira profundimaris]|uniref:site-specific DNA-methyltransferase (adenine-specific) n=1 Tax=Thalassospira profundimaris TaxID=502049 RepID=A0A367WQA5_9PROT|nr:DNA methyltransferase [Thalassospira profundimaris]RCK43656.1 lactate dehydrogenase [Thalassospira profundimaris]